MVASSPHKLAARKKELAMIGPSTIRGPLRVHPTNSRYFTDDGERVVYLTGSHTWANLQDIGLPGGPPFPYREYLDFMEAYGHNFMRLWMFEQPERASWTEEPIIFDPLPWQRTGPGLAVRGKPRFDLDTWNEDYFRRLRERTVAAAERGIYVAIMLFQGWSLHKVKSAPYGDPWPVHPFNAANNINGVDVPYTAVDDDENPCLHSLLNPDVLARQEAYVRHVIDTVNDLGNVLYEIINEGGSTAWQYHMIDYIHEYERTLPGQHPVGMTHRIDPRQRNADLLASPADWISPANEPQGHHVPGAVLMEDYQNDPPAADGRKVVLLDTDHLWGHGGNPYWVWKSFCRGHNPIFMDPWWPLYINSDPAYTPWTFVGGISKDQHDYPDWEPTRRAMGDTRRYAERMNLAAMTPRPTLASTGYCLAHPGHEYLIYLPQGGSVTINLCEAVGRFAVEWYLPGPNRTLSGAYPLEGGDYVVTTAPYTGDAVLYLKKM
jgi:hypothetical protein